MHLIVVSACN